jgi:hypothetical protein
MEKSERGRRMNQEQRQQRLRQLGDAFLYGWPVILLGVVWLIVEVSQFADPLFSHAIELPAPTKEVPNPSPNVHLAFRAAFFLMLIAIAVLSTLWLRQIALPSSSRAKRELSGLVGAINKIVHGLYRIDDQTRWSFTRVRANYFINGNCDGRVVLEYELKAGQKPAQVWRFKFNADETAKAIDWLDEVDLKVELINPVQDAELKYLLYNNSPRKKEIAIFFLPEIQPNESRTVKISYSWPRFAADLLEKGSTEFQIEFKTVDPGDLADVQYDFEFASSLGPMNFDQIGPKDAPLVAIAMDGRNGRFGWRYSHPSLSMNGRTLKFVASRELG